MGYSFGCLDLDTRVGHGCGARKLNDDDGQTDAVGDGGVVAVGCGSCCCRVRDVLDGRHWALPCVRRSSSADDREATARAERCRRACWRRVRHDASFRSAEAGPDSAR